MTTANYAPQFKDKTMAELREMEAKTAKRKGVLADPIMLNIIQMEIACRLPPDPEGENDNRAKWALSAIEAFEGATGTDREDALADLLGDLMHWADRSGADFEYQLERARNYYRDETTATVYHCAGCQREESVCSADPCEGVKREREG